MNGMLKGLSLFIHLLTVLQIALYINSPSTLGIFLVCFNISMSVWNIWQSYSFNK